MPGENIEAYRLDIRNEQGVYRFSCTYGYLDGKLPRAPQRKKTVPQMLREALKQWESGRPVEIGFAENDTKRVRRDDWEIERKEKARGKG